jgi:short chain dehydrogenase
MKRFDNRTVIVTGGARGMGASHARGFVAEGANVVIADVLDQEGRPLADELGDQAIFSRLDVTSDSDWAATVGRRRERLRPGLRAGQQRGHRALRTDHGDRAGGLAPGDRHQPDRHVSGDSRDRALDAQGRRRRDRQYLLRGRDDGLPQHRRVRGQQVGSAGTDQDGGAGARARQRRRHAPRHGTQLGGSNLTNNKGGNNHEQDRTSGASHTQG